MVLKLVESDLYKLISSTVKKILKENVESNEILSKIVERLTNADVTSYKGENYVDVPLDEEGDIIACIDYEIEDNRYFVNGAISNGYDYPDDPDRVEGDFNVYVSNIILDDNGQQTKIEDNGMVQNALKNLVDPSIEDLETYNYEDEDQSGWNDSWR